MEDKWDADPEDAAVIKDGLVHGLIVWEDIPGNRQPDFQPLITTRQAFTLLAERVRRLQALDPVELHDYQRRQREQELEELKDRARLPYVAAIGVLLIVLIFAFLVCSPRW